MKSRFFSFAAAFATLVSLMVSTPAHAVCISTSHALGYAQINSYNPDGSANITAYTYDWDNQGAGTIARYNTSGQILEVTSGPYINFVLPKGAHQYIVFKDVCKDGSFAGHWDRGFNW